MMDQTFFLTFVQKLLKIFGENLSGWLESPTKRTSLHRQLETIRV